MKPTTALVVCVIVFTSCHRYYMPTNIQRDPKEVIQKLKDDNKQLILRDEKFVYQLSDVSWQQESLTAKLQKITSFKSVHNKKKSRINYYFSPGQPDSVITGQVHIITSRPLTYGIEPEATIPFDAIASIEELTFDKRKTTRNRVATVLAVGSGVVVTVAFISFIREAKGFVTWGDY